MTESAPFLSVVIPAYNEEARIGLTLSRTIQFLRARGLSHEVLVVDDGSSDGTVNVVEGVAQGSPDIRVVRQPRNRGKGAAVRRGVEEARGEYILFMDADLATPIEELENLLVHARNGVDVAIGSRGLAESDIRRHQPRLRELMGRGFNLIVRSLLLGGFHDTQCGFKLFTRAAAKDLFGRQLLDGFAFDVEVLLLAKESGYRIREVPVVWYHAENSKVSPLADATKMFSDLVMLKVQRFRQSRRA
jgi:dolichyl-phosphate beta-glucosyltransferase